MLANFYLTFFNTGILVCVANASFWHMIPVGFMEHYFGKAKVNHEVGSRWWYENVGPLIVETMTIQAILPILNFLVVYFVRKLKQIFDRVASSNGVTFKSDLAGYVDLFAGPESIIHYRYSDLMTIIFITFIYGGALPILFPIAFLATLILILSEKLQLAYYHRAQGQY